MCDIMIVDGFSNGKIRWKMMYNLDLIFRLLFKISDKVVIVKKINESKKIVISEIRQLGRLS